MLTCEKAQRNGVQGGRKPQNAMSLCYADTNLPDLLGRPSLCPAVRASAVK